MKSRRAWLSTAVSVMMYFFKAVLLRWLISWRGGPPDLKRSPPAPTPPWGMASPELRRRPNGPSRVDRQPAVQQPLQILVPASILWQRGMGLLGRLALMERHLPPTPDGPVLQGQSEGGSVDGHQQERILVQVLAVPPLRLEEMGTAPVVGDALPRPVVPVGQGVNSLEHGRGLHEVMPDFPQIECGCLVAWGVMYGQPGAAPWP